jgi:hypothetical protein
VKYTRLKREQKEELQRGLVLQLEQEHFATGMAITRASAIDDPSLETHKKNQADLEKQIKALLANPEYPADEPTETA